MGRPAIVNQVPVAPFSLVNCEPMEGQEVYKRLGYKRFHAVGGAEPEDRATLDPSNCPTCAAKVEWAKTFKRIAGHAKGGVTYVYARCKANPKEHRWGFRDQGSTPRATPPAVTEPVEAEPTPIPVVEAIPQETHTVSATPNPNPGSLDSIIGAIIDQRIGVRLEAVEDKLKAPALDPDAVREIVSGMISEVQTTTLKIESGERVITLEGVRHPIADEIAERIELGQRDFMLVGPAGTGKTSISELIRDVLKATGTTIPMSEDMRRENFVGFRGYDIQKGTSPFQDTALIRDLEASKDDAWVVTVFEECDAANANVMLTLNTLTNGFLSTPDDVDHPRRVRGKNHVVIMTANTFGTAQTGSMAYVGRNQLDAATLSRYRTLFVGYDPKVERAVVGDTEVVALFERMRAKADALKLRRVICTRMARQCAQDRHLSKLKGKPLAEVFTNMATNLGWARDEISKVLGA